VQQAGDGSRGSRHKSQSRDHHTHDSRDRDSRDRDSRHRNGSATDSRRRDGRDEDGKGTNSRDAHQGDHSMKDGGRRSHHIGGGEDGGSTDVSSMCTAEAGTMFSGSSSSSTDVGHHLQHPLMMMMAMPARNGSSTSSSSSEGSHRCPHKLWVAPLIRVRIVDKRMQSGRLYLKKGCVLDVAPDGSCDIRLEGGRQVATAHQDQLETVVPKEAGAAVMVVQGRHKGRKGRLLQVSLSSGAAALQLVGDMEVVRLLLDDVAQFMGHLEEEDH